MTCCAPHAETKSPPQVPQAQSSQEIRLASRRIDGGLLQTNLSVPSAHCGACMATIEDALSRLDGVVSARLNLSTRRVTVAWRESGSAPAPPFLQVLAEVGYVAHLFSEEENDADPEMQRLLRATAVAGFAAMNIMLLSVSVWAGADPVTRHAFHSLSALLAVFAVAYAGRIFFLSAWSAIRSGGTNMDVPIAVGIVLALALSLYDTFRNGPYAYFDAVTTLIFFLLVGRSLEHAMRRKARSSVLGLARLMPRGATVVSPDGARRFKPQHGIAAGELVYVGPGDRIPLDGTVESGMADVDASLVTGEAAPVAMRPGNAVLSGMLNLNGALQVRVARPACDSFIADMIRLMEAAEHGRARYRRLADRAAALYSPVVHALAAAAFLGWMAATGDWHRALTVAISVLIITCPCALGLAAPIVQVVAARRLFERGIALKDGSALERLAEADIAVFDKTGTLTLSDLQVASCSVPEEHFDGALALACRSRHPGSRAVAALGSNANSIPVDGFREIPGMGVQGLVAGRLYRLGRADWALGRKSPPSTRGSVAVLSVNSEEVGSFAFADALRPHAREAIAALRDQGLRVEVLSGDCAQAVSSVAAALGIEEFSADLLPQDKVARLEEMGRSGRKSLMVGDGLNDSPALASAHVSMAPASAADVGRAAADLVFFGSGLTAVPEAIWIARTARRLVHQNLALAVGYNLLVIPAALAGLVTPLIAALAMSLSSILVVGNALRFPRMRNRKRFDTRRKEAMPPMAEPAR